MRSGRFVVFEGGEGTGKSTQARLLAEALRGAGGAVTLTREPGGAAGAEALRRLLLDPQQVAHWCPLSEALLHYAARHEHVEKTIRPALERGEWVICDRFCDSTRAYQGGGLGLGSSVLQQMQQMVLGDFGADLTIVLDLPVAMAARRIAARAVAASGRDRYEELGNAFHERVRTAFRQIADEGGGRYALIDAGPPAERVHVAICALLRNRLGVAISG